MSYLSDLERDQSQKAGKSAALKPVKGQTRAGSYLDEGGATRIALVGFLTRVDAQVSLQVGRPVELGSTHAAAVRLLTC